MFLINEIQTQTREKINISLLYCCGFWRGWSSISQQWTQCGITRVSTHKTRIMKTRGQQVEMVKPIHWFTVECDNRADSSSHCVAGYLGSITEIELLCRSQWSHCYHLMADESCLFNSSLSGLFRFWQVPLEFQTVFFLPILAPKQRKFKSSFTGVYWDISAHKTLCLLLECTIN